MNGKIYCEACSIDGSKYEVVEDRVIGEKRRSMTYKVDFDENNQDVTCNCKLFEFRGILCGHAITILIHKKIYKIPDKYILNRWRKDIKRCHTRVNISYNSMAVKEEAK